MMTIAKQLEAKLQELNENNRVINDLLEKNRQIDAALESMKIRQTDLVEVVVDLQEELSSHAGSLVQTAKQQAEEALANYAEALREGAITKNRADRQKYLQVKHQDFDEYWAEEVPRPQYSNIYDRKK